MPASHSLGSETIGHARGLRLTRRRLLGASAGLVVSSALHITGPAPLEARQLDPEGLIDALGLSTHGLPSRWTFPPIGGSVLDVPYRSQLDGSPQAKANCGPASLSMLLARFGDEASIADIRWSVNRFMRNWRADNGSSWEALSHAAEMRGYQVSGLFADKGAHRKWTVEALVGETARDNAVIILTRYRALPGHAGGSFRYNHYIVVVGDDPDGSIVYHDPAYPDAAAGAFLRITRQQLDTAWSSVSSGIVHTGMVVRPAAKR